ncbi:hypothetical protein P43SY_001962 [Pythium insidiosum]|uniref:PDZ domain-containing protein n=1 Tax=Pythium insidiosum TaxID=114742 RepID=A0AAD5M8N8_PYTIN|nr:hypothetical protein P43SY_001962 [Pythium insidiosum]
MTIDADLIVRCDPEVVRPRRPLVGSFQQWMNQTMIEEDAARKIQAFMRKVLHRPAPLDLNIISYGTGTTFSLGSQDSEEDDVETFDVFLWHGTNLGLDFFPCNITGLPCVEEANGNDALPGMWNLRVGDYLISINNDSTHSDDMPFDMVMQILEDGVRPAVLRFRRPRIHEMRTRPGGRARRLLSRSSSLAKREQQRRRERLEKSLSYVVWREEDPPLGIVLKPDYSKPYPTVTEVTPNGVVGREDPDGREMQRNRVRAGDLLLSINHMDVSSMGYRKSLDILKYAPRPLVLTFRRSTPEYRPTSSRSLEL